MKLEMPRMMREKRPGALVDDVGVEELEDELAECDVCEGDECV